MHASTLFRTALRRRILTGLTALAPTACTVEGQPATTTDDPATTAASSTSEAPDGTTTAPAATTTTIDPTTGAPPDPGSTSDASAATTAVDSEDPGTTSDATATTTATSSTSTTADDTTTGPMHDVERCFYKFDVDAECPDLAMAAMVYPCTDMFEEVLEFLSGPVEIDGECCYHVDVAPPGGGCIPGRPFVVDGRIQRAPVRAGARGWTGDPRRAGLADLDPATRTRLGQAWAHDAALEHASVASFGKLALELLAFGAPAELVRAAHDAARDEIRHAELCFALASRYLGAPVGPGPLPAAAAFTGARTLAELAAAAVREGCVGETLAAAVAAAQAEAAADEALRATLASIAADEADHAALAYRVVAWALAAGGAPVRASVAVAFAAALEEPADDPADDPASPDLRAHGRLSSSDVRAERRRTITDVIRPAMTALLGLPS